MHFYLNIQIFIYLNINLENKEKIKYKNLLYYHLDKNYICIKVKYEV